MHDFLPALAQLLRDRLDGPRQVAVIPHEDLPPDRWQLPFVGICDDLIEIEKAKFFDIWRGQVEIYLFQSLLTPAEGDAVTGRAGVVLGLSALAEQVRVQIEQHGRTLVAGMSDLWLAEKGQSRPWRRAGETEPTEQRGRILLRYRRDMDPVALAAA